MGRSPATCLVLVLGLAGCEFVFSPASATDASPADDADIDGASDDAIDGPGGWCAGMTAGESNVHFCADASNDWAGLTCVGTGSCLQIADRMQILAPLPGPS